MVFEFDEFELDEALFELRRRGQRTRTQPKVLLLLLHLVKNRDRVVTTRELFDALWPGQAVGPTSIAKAIRGARRALGDTGDSQAVLRTVRTHGYRFVASVRERNASLETIRRRLETLSSDLAALRDQVGEPSRTS